MIDPVKQIIVVRKDLIDREDEQMTSGKLAGQVAHASMAPFLEMARGAPYNETNHPKGSYTLEIEVNEGSALKDWLEKDFRKIVLYVKNEQKLLDLHAELKEAGFIASLVQDKGLTIFSEPTYTCLGVEPLRHSEIHPFVKRLQLLK